MKAYETHIDCSARSRLLPALALAAAIGLGGCAGNPTREDIGTVTGAVVGGVTGSVLTGGSTAGTIGGAVAGGFVGKQVGKELQRR